MPLRKSIAALAVLFSLSAPAAFGLDSHGVPQEGAPAAAPLPVMSEAQLRSMLIAKGVDPDSPRAKVLLKWMPHITSDPAWRAAMSQRDQSGAANPFNFGAVSPAVRLQFLAALGNYAAQADDGACVKIMAGKMGATSFMDSPPEVMDAGFTLFDAMLEQPRDAAEKEHYSTAELLDAESLLYADIEADIAKRKPALPSQASGASAVDRAQTQSCALVRSMFSAMMNLPEPQRTRATWDFFSAFQGAKTASDRVLADPHPYFDEAFDDQALPQAMRDRLPPEGSHPLPFKRLVVTGEWVNKDTPGDSGPYEMEFVNRHDNGVVSHITHSPSDAKKSAWAHLEMGYGVVSLRSETLSNGASLTPLAQLPDSTAIPLDWPAVTEGTEIAFPAPQPFERHITSTRCKVGHKRPASTVFPSLTGDAIDLSCTDIVDQGKDDRYQDVWLSDYGLALPVSIVDEDGLTLAHIKNITVSK